MKLKIKVLIFISVMIALTTGLIFFATSAFAKNYHIFPSDGYAIMVPEEQSDGSVSMIFFRKGSPYQTFYPNMIKFQDKDGHKATVNGSCFLHLSDESVMALKDGVLVDLSEVSNGFMNHYGISAYTILQKDNGQQYHPEGRADIFISGCFLYKIEDNRYLFIMNSDYDATITTPLGEDYHVKNYVEIDFPLDGVVRFTTMDKSVQMSTNQTKLYTGISGNHICIDFTDKILITATGTQVALDDIDVHNENNLSVDAAMRIPYYSILGEDGEEGIAGVAGIEGTTGKSGIFGETGEDGEAGEEGIQGQTGSVGTTGSKGSRGIKGANGDNLMDEESQEALPTASFTSFHYTKDSVEATVHFSSYEGLTGLAKALLFRTSTGEIAASNLSIPIGIDIGDITVTFHNLENSNEYCLILYADYILSGSGASGTVAMLNRKFLTSDLKLSVLQLYRNDAEIAYQIENNENCDFQLMLSLYDTSKNILIDEEELTIPALGKDTVVFDNLSSNSNFNMMLQLYMEETDCYACIQTVDSQTLKKAPTGLEQISIAANSLQGTFSFTMDGDIEDTDHAITAYYYELFGSDGELKKTLEANSLDAVTLVPDNQIIYEGIPYSVRGRVDYYDNEKMVSILTPYASDSVMIIPNVTVDTQFVQNASDTGTLSFTVIATAINTTLVADEMHPVTITLVSPDYVNYSVNVTQVNADGTVTADVYKTSLYTNMTYIATISGYTDNLGDGNLQYSEWGSATFTLE